VVLLVLFLLEMHLDLENQESVHLSIWLFGKL